MTAPQRSNPDQMLWRLLTLATGLVASEITVWMVARVWRLVRGDEPPRPPGAPGSDRAASLRWALASGAAVAVSHVLARRVTAEAWKAATGSYPAGVATEATEATEA